MLLYLLPNLGLGVSAHFCEGDLAHISFSDCESNICPCNNKPMKKGVCENKEFCMKLTINQNCTPPIYLSFEKKINDILLKTTFPSITNTFLKDYLRTERYFNLLRPPQKTSLPLYVLNRNFRV
jgi:hypothetical protein